MQVCTCIYLSSLPLALALGHFLKSEKEIFSKYTIETRNKMKHIIVILKGVSS